MKVTQEPKFIKTIYIRSQNADPAPPLGTILGNLGVNTTNFCTTFNLHTKNIPAYFLLKTKISIFDNKSTSFVISQPSIGFLLNLLKFEQSFKFRTANRTNEKVLICIRLYDLIKLAKFKFFELPLDQSFKMI